MFLFVFHYTKILRWVPKDMRRHGVLESLKDQNVAAIVEEADYVENSGYYDQDGNWVYYDEYQENQQPQSKPKTQPEPQQQQPKPVQNGLKPAKTAAQPTKPQAQQAQAEAAQAAQEAAQAAQEAAQAAKGLMKGITGFGKSSGFSLGGLMKTVAAEPAPTVQKKPVQPAKPLPKPQDPNFPKPCTNNMTAKQRWHWAHRRIVQVFLSKIATCIQILLLCCMVKYFLCTILFRLLCILYFKQSILK